MRNKKYSDELKEQVVKEYLAGSRMLDLVRKYDLSDKSRIQRWKNKYLEYGEFPDGRGKKSGGRPRKVEPSVMTEQEYIRYLEMENDILKQLRSLSSSQAK